MGRKVYYLTEGVEFALYLTPGPEVHLDRPGLLGPVFQDYTACPINDLLEVKTGEWETRVARVPRVAALAALTAKLHSELDDLEAKRILICMKDYETHGVTRIDLRNLSHQIKAIRRALGKTTQQMLAKQADDQAQLCGQPTPGRNSDSRPTSGSANRYASRQATSRSTASPYSGLNQVEVPKATGTAGVSATESQVDTEAAVASEILAIGAAVRLASSSDVAVSKDDCATESLPAKLKDDGTNACFYYKATFAEDYTPAELSACLSPRAGAASAGAPPTVIKIRERIRLANGKKRSATDTLRKALSACQKVRRTLGNTALIKLGAWLKLTALATQDLEAGLKSSPTLRLTVAHRGTQAITHRGSQATLAVALADIAAKGRFPIAVNTISDLLKYVDVRVLLDDKDTVTVVSETDDSKDAYDLIRAECSEGMSLAAFLYCAHAVVYHTSRVVLLRTKVLHTDNSLECLLATRPITTLEPGEVTLETGLNLPHPIDEKWRLVANARQAIRTETATLLYLTIIAAPTSGYRVLIGDVDTHHRMKVCSRLGAWSDTVTLKTHKVSPLPQKRGGGSGGGGYEGHTGISDVLLGRLNESDHLFIDYQSPDHYVDYLEGEACHHEEFSPALFYHDME